MDRDEIKRLLIAVVAKEWDDGISVITTEEWVQQYCLNPNNVDVNLLACFLRNSRDLPREQREAVVAYVRSKEHEHIDGAYDKCIKEFEDKEAF